MSSLKRIIKRMESLKRNVRKDRHPRKLTEQYGRDLTVLTSIQHEDDCKKALKQI